MPEERRATILVVDDTEALRYAMVRQLQHAGYRVMEAGTGEESLRMAREHLPDLVVLDVKLPDILGYEVCRQLKRDAPTAQIPVLHVSATYTSMEYKVRGLDSGADGFLTAPVEPEELLAHVRLLLRLKASNDRLASVLSSIAEGYFVVDSQWRLLRVNRAAEQSVFLKPASELIGQMIWDQLPGSRESAYGQQLQAAAARQEVRHFECQAGQAGKWFEMHAHPRGPELEVYLHDITAAKQTQQKLRDSEARARQQLAELEGIYRTAPLGLCVFDEELRYRRVNERLAEMNGISVEAHLGKTVAELLPSLADQAAKLLRQVLSTGQPVRGELRGETRSQPGVERIWDEYWYPLAGANGKTVGAGVVVDEITERRHAEQALQEARELLSKQAAHLETLVRERTSKLAETLYELEMLSYNIIHDMRAPLRAMEGYARTLQDDQGERLGAVGHEYLQRIIAAAQRQDQLIRDVLSYTRVLREQPPLDTVELDPLVQDVIHQYPELQSHADHIQAQAPLGSVLGHKALLAQCLTNLLSNAIKFMPPGRQPEVKIWTERRPETVRLYIQDNGIGIDPEFHSRIFGMFQRLHAPSQYGGTGIGLAVARKAAERMGGTLGLSSAADKGSRFWVELKPPAPP